MLRGAIVITSLFDSGLSRWSIRLPTTNIDHQGVGFALSMSRNAVVQPNFRVNCREFRSWPESCWACEQFLHRIALGDSRHELALLFTMPNMIVGDCFQFSELQLRCPAASEMHAPNDMHGLLGHRTHWRPTQHNLRASKRARSRQSSTRHTANTKAIQEIRWEESKHTWEGGVAVAGLTRVDRVVESTLEMTSEGIIEGASSYYRVISLDSHEFRYSRLNCTIRGTLG